MALYRRGLFALSADPVHKGHIHIIQKAADLCDELIVYVTDSHTKKYTFLRDIRERMLRAVIPSLSPG